MVKVKMKYGIDLGTTNSAICKIENGEPVIRKTDTLKDTLPSCVSFTKKKVIRVGDSAYNDLRQDKSRGTKRMTNDGENVYIEFKRTMGSSTQYMSSYMGRGFSSEELSAEVLKTLRSFITEESITSAVITIPAKFKQTRLQQQNELQHWRVLHIANSCRSLLLPLWHTGLVQPKKTAIGWYSTLVAELLTLPY